MKKRMCAALALLVLCIGAWRLARPAPPPVLRLQVIAAGDSEAEQAVKLRVKGALVSRFSPRWKGAASAREAEALALQDRDLIEETVRQTLEDAGCACGAKVEFGAFAFPEKTYRGVVYPAGTYRALRVTLGEGRGRNWWCVLYPPLCLEDPEEAPVYTSWLLARLGIDVRWKGNRLWKK